MKEKNALIMAQFEDAKGWMESAVRLIEIGKATTGIPEPYKDEATLVEGCQSKVWIHCLVHHGKCHFIGTSDSVIVRGIVEVLIQYYDQETPEDIQAADEPEFIQALGLLANMPQTRSKGLDSIIKHIKRLSLQA